MEPSDKRAAVRYVSEMERDGLWTPADVSFCREFVR